MALNDLDILSKGIVRTIIDSMVADDCFTFTGLTDKLREVGYNGNASNEARLIGKELLSSVLAGTDIFPLEIAKMYEYPRLEGRRLIDDDLVTYPMRSIPGNAIIYRRLDGEIQDF